MKKSTLTAIAVLVTCFGLQAQKFTLQPQVGMQNSTTRLSVNNLNSFNPLSSQLAPMLGIRADYKMKNGFGPFVGITTNRSTVAFNFSSPETATTNYTATMGDYQVQLQAGLQARTNPLYFKKNPPPAKVVTPPAPQSFSSMSRCGRSKAMQRAAAEKAAAPGKASS